MSRQQNKTKWENIFQLFFFLLSLALVAGKKYSKVTLQMVEIIHSISIHFPRLLWQPGLCHNYHKFIYSSGVFWEVKQGGRYFDKTTRESREEFCCAEGVLGVVSVLWFRVVWVFFYCNAHLQNNMSWKLFLPSVSPCSSSVAVLAVML